MSTELEALARAAEQIDGDAAAGEPAAMLAADEAAQAEGQVLDGAAQVQMILGLAVPILGKMFPSLLGVYTPEACAAVGASVAPVLAKYDIDLSKWGGAYKEEIMMVMVCGPIVVATVQGIKADTAAKMASKPKDATLRAPPGETPKATKIDHEAVQKAVQVERLG